MKQALFALAALLPLTANAQTFPEVGARALALGGAYVALADGPTALYWNPAAMPLRPPGTSLLYGRATTDPEGLGDRLDDLGATRATASDIGSRPADAARAVDLLGAIGAEPDPILGQQPWGFFWSGGTYGLSLLNLTLVEALPLVDQTHVGLTDDPETDLRRNESTLRLHSLALRDLVVSMAGSVGDPRLLLGVNARWSSGETKLSAPSLFAFPDFQTGDVFDHAADGDSRRSSDFSLDIGTLVTPHPKFRLGLVGKYLFSPEFATIDGGKFQIEPRWRSGLALLPSPMVTITADVDLSRQALAPSTVETRNLAVGLQFTLAEGALALRGGLREAIEGPNDRLVTGGIGVMGKGMTLDVAVGYAPRTSSATFAIEFGYWPQSKR